MKRAAINRIYCPKFNKNRELPENEQVTVEIDLATIKEKEKFAMMKYGKKGKMEYIKKEYTAMRQKIQKISNYFDNTEQPIDTAEKLIADMKAGSPESVELSEELWDHIMGYDKLKEDEEDDEEDDEEEDRVDSSESGEALSKGEE